MAGRFLAFLPPPRCETFCVLEAVFWKELLFSASFSPVRKSFDVNPLAILVQAGLTSAPKGKEDRIQRCKYRSHNGLRFGKGNSSVVLERAGICRGVRGSSRKCVHFRKLALICVNLHIELQLQLGAVSIDQRVVDLPFVPGCGRLLGTQWLSGKGDWLPDVVYRASTSYNV